MATYLLESFTIPGVGVFSVSIYVITPFFFVSFGAFASFSGQLVFTCSMTRSSSPCPVQRMNLAEIRIHQLGSLQVGLRQVGFLEVGRKDNGAMQIGPPKVGLLEICSLEHSGAKVDP